MENYFYQELNKRTVEAVNRGTAFFMNPQDSHIPRINNTFTGEPITGANYYNLKLSNDICGRNHTEYAKVNEVLSSNIDWLSTLPREGRPRGILYQEDGSIYNGGKKAGYSFVVPVAELNQTIYRDNHIAGDRAAAPDQYIPFQTSNAAMSNFNEFVHEQCANAINASLSNCPFKSNIRPQEMEQFKTQLVNEIAKNPGFMAASANRARDEALEYHHLPLDRSQFMERARNENSPEFMRLNSAITDHVYDMYHNKKNSFNPGFNELSRPLILIVGNLHRAGMEPGTAVDREITEFLRKQIRRDRTAKVLADTFAGTHIEKAVKLARIGKKVFGGIMIAGALCGTVIASQANIGPLDQIVNFCNHTMLKLGGVALLSRLDDVVKVASHIMSSQELKGDRSLKTCRDRNDSQSFYANLNRVIHDNPAALDHAIAQVNSHQRTQSASRGQAIRR